MKEIGETLKESIIEYLYHIFFNLTNVLYKYYMNIKYINCYEILTFEGIIELFLFIITSIITISIRYTDEVFNNSH